jgi:hypothetical protein
MNFRFSELVGRYRLEVTDELAAFIERVFVAPVPAGEQSMVRADALDEARGSELEALPDGSLVSRSRGQEFFRVNVGDGDALCDELTFEKAPGVTVRIEIRDRDTLVAPQPGRLTAVFRRVSG